ncbi:MAG: hypothetical protein IPK69_03425 [Phycisphaerales bacterium]|nr:MAG: hypothetical protein IPK69_03425 [Phycisphaerales bacterium]
MSTWSGSLMGQAGRDPLFFAQMTLANQDVSNVGYYCMRCHVPSSFVSGHALQADGSTLDASDREGVSCHFCHSMVDPVYRPGVSPVEDAAILAGMPEVPGYYGDAMFVLDPAGRRRGPRSDSEPLHEFIHSPFHSTGNFCGTCHDVGNVAVTKQADGTYRYNALNEPTPSLDPAHQFPLERTYTEWRLSEFASSGVDMGGRFNGNGPSVIRTCQDCHMPKSEGLACIVGPNRTQMASHEFAGASAQVLDIIAKHTLGDPAVDQNAIARGRASAVSMLRRAASLEVRQSGGMLKVRVTNESGHKLPTGHIEGRRVWVNVQFRDSTGTIVRENGRYDETTSTLDEDTTTVYEMLVGLSTFAAQATGLPAGRTTHMALADSIVKDNRIPPRGFNNATYANAGAPVVDATYADGQYWSDVEFRIPLRAVSAAVRLLYQQTPKEYIEHLRDHNHTDTWGQTLYSLWSSTGRGAPIEMIGITSSLIPFCPADLDDGSNTGTPDGAVTIDDLLYYLTIFQAGHIDADIDDGTATGAPDQAVTIDDLLYYIERFQLGC